MMELFIVEGESAASTVRQAMHKTNQSVLACQGKLINVEKASHRKVLANPACQKIFQALGCGIKEQCTPSLLMYSRILILTDPDIDGAHARVLLLKLFHHYLRPLINADIISVILPPLFRIRNSQSTNHQYAWDEQQAQSQNNKALSEITRFKGVAQFSVDECNKLLLHPDTRKQINIMPTEMNYA